MSKYVQTYAVNYRLKHMGDEEHHLEEYVEKHLSDNPDLRVKQVEYMYGSDLGARVIVVYEEKSDES